MSLRAGGLTGLMNQPSAQVIDGSLRFNTASDLYLTRTPGSASNRKTWTWSAWVNKSSNGIYQPVFFGNQSGSNNTGTGLRFANTDAIEFYEYSGSSFTYRLLSNRVLRDVRGWYHLVIAFDTTQSTAADRIRIYVNGEQVTSWASATYPSQNTDGYVNNNTAQYIGAYNFSDSVLDEQFDGGMSQVYLIDGLSLGPRFFGFNDPLTGTWRPRKLKEGDVTINDGTVWSSGIPGNNHADYPVTNAFDGNTSTFVYAAGTSTMTWTAPKPVSGKKIEVYVYAGGGWPILKVNGQSTGAVQGGTTQHNVWVDVTHLCPGGNLETIQAFGANISGTDRQSGFSAVRVDGEILIDRKVSNSKNPNNGTTWSNSLTTNAGDNFDGSGAKTKAFDGNGANKAYTANNSNGTTQGTSYLEMVFPTAISGALRVKCDNGNTVRNTTGGGDVLLATQSTGSDNQFVDCGTVSGLTNLRVLMSGGSRPAISIIELDGHVFIDGAVNNGFYLPMDGNSPVGEDKSGFTTINTGIVWSSYGDNTNINKTYPWHFAFDGRATGAYQQGAGATDGAGWARWTPGVTITVNTKLRINTDNGSTSAVKVKFSGSSEQHLTSLTDGWNDVSGTGTLEYIEIYNSGSTWSYLTAVEVDGVILVDGVKGNSFTPVNFNGSVELDKATGALPILNTTQGGTQAGVGVRTDAYSANLALALPLVNDKDDVSNLINGESTKKTITNNGVNVSSVPGNFYNGSFYWDGGTTDRLTVTYNSEFQLGTGDFCIEFWVNLSTSSGNQYFFDFDSNGGVLQYNGNVLSYSDGYVAGGGPLYSTGVTLPIGKWVHLAVTRESSRVRIFVDGKMRATGTSTYNYNQTSVLDIGNGYNNSGYEITGYMQDFRIYKGVAKYTSDFIVPSTNPDILPNSPSGVSGGSKLTKIADGAVSFDADGDYLSMADSSDFAFGTGDFTAECFIYPKGNVNYRAIIDCRDQVSDPGGWILGVNANDQLYIYTDGFLLTSADTNTVTAENKWYHVAYVRNSGTHKIYIDGKEADSSSTSIDYDSDNCVIGASYAKNSEYWNGFISNVRLVKGTALYTANFTPPTEPLTNVTNTKLLCCQSNTQPGAAVVAPNVSGSLNTGTQWSAFASSNAAFSTTNTIQKAFDGDDSTKANTAANTGYSQTSNYNNAIEFVPPFPIPYSSSIKVIGRNTGQTTMGVKIDRGSGYGSEIALSDDDLQTVVSGSGNLVRMQVVTKTYSGENELGGIQIDGVYLTDPVSPSGDAAATNFNPFNTDINTVLGQETGYATFNPLRNYGVTTPLARYSEGNLRAQGHASTKNANAVSTLGASSGKWYFEVEMIKLAESIIVTISNEDKSTLRQLQRVHDRAYAEYWDGSSWTNLGSGTQYTTGDTVSVAVDIDNGKVTFYKNGIIIKKDGTFKPNGDTFYFGCGQIYDDLDEVRINFGQKPFKFPPPPGFKSLSNTNLIPETVISRPDQYVAVTTYSGDDTDPRQINLGMAPDLIWVKTMNQTNWPWLSDSVRGTADKRYKLYSNDDTAQDTAPIYGQADSFNDFGFVAGGGTDGGGGHLSDSNKSGTNYVVWSWKAGGSKGTFNVDDVGYANASDVNMSVGALNNIAYNQSQNWSGNATGGQNVDRAFDGTGPRKDHYSHSSNSLTVNFSPALSGRIIVYGGVGGSGSDTYTLSDGSSLSSPQYYGTAPYYEALDFGVRSNITSVTCSNGYTLYGIRVDGKLLVDSGVSINAPSIPATACSVGTKQGFSIIKYQANSTAGATIPHGLSQAPNFVLVKSLQTAGSSNSDWTVFHSTLRGTKAMYLNEQDGSGASGSWRDKDPDANLITLGTAHVSNLDPNYYIAYAWHDVPGLQKFGSYGGADAFVELGFRPAVLIIKSETGSRNWIIIDSTRDTFNPSDRALLVNDNAQEDDNSVYAIDFLSNGFKIQGSNGQIDGDSSYIYAAWAEAPAFNLYGGQSNAR